MYEYMQVLPTFLPISSAEAAFSTPGIIVQIYKMFLVSEIFHGPQHPIQLIFTVYYVG